MGRLTYRVEGFNGDVITLNNITPQDYFKAAGASGLGVADTKITKRTGAGPGAKFRSSKRLDRTIPMPIHIFGSDADAIESKQRRIIRLLNDTYGNARLVAKYPDGSEWATEIHYGGGADLVYGSEDTNGRDYATWLMELWSPDPYFTSLTPIFIEPIRTASSGRGLIKTGGGGLSRLRLSSSQTIGAFQVENTGDVEAYPIWQIKGPGDSFSATRVIDGGTFDISSAILSTETFTIDTQAKTVKDQTGANRYSTLGNDFLFPIPPGNSTINILVPNATVATQIDMRFYPRKELVFG